jgi:hypothetical protein
MSLPTGRPALLAAQFQVVQPEAAAVSAAVVVVLAAAAAV